MFLSVIPRIAAHQNLRIADLGVIGMPARDGIAVNDPVLLADIISPNSYAETRANIWAYATLPSVREILVVSQHPHRGRAVPAR